MEDRTSLDRLVEHVLGVAEEFELWKPHDTIIVAVSGGPDSVALLHVLHKISLQHTPLHLICAHVHHGFRAESDEEARFVANMAQVLGIPFEMKKIDVPSYMRESRKGPEEAAREKRYEFLVDTAVSYKASSIALGHHADDQAETVMMRLLRGSGLTGLAGMKLKRREKNVELIRPFLRIYKTDLIDVCKKNGYAYAVDATNLMTTYRRNAIRLDVLPFLGQYNSQIIQSLNHLAEIAGVEDDYVQQAAEEAYRDLVHDYNGRLTLQVPSFLALHVALQRRLIKLILNYLSVSSENTDFHKIETIRQKVVRNHSTTWSLDLGESLVCMREYDQMIFMHRSPEQKISYTYQLDTAVPELLVSEIGKVLRMAERPAEEGYIYHMADSGQQAVFDADRLQFPLTLRSRLPGDTMKVMGLNGSKKVKDIFIDAKIPPSMRSHIPVLIDGSGNIVWIPGVRRSIHAAIRKNSKSLLHMVLEDAGTKGQL